MRSGWWKALILGLCVGVVGLLVGPLRFMLAFDEDFGLGLLFRLRGPVRPPPEAVVISIDRESSEHLGLPDNPDKWPRSLHAQLTEILSREGAAVISFDLHFIEPRVEKDDRAFAAAIGSAGNVILTEPIRTKDIPLTGPDGSYDSHNVVRLVPPIPLLADAAVATAPFTLPRIPFKVSRFFTFEPGAGDAPSVPMIALQIYCAPAYGEFVRLLQNAAPGQAGEFRFEMPRAGAGESLRRIMMRIRQLFSDDPSLAGRMRKELAGSGLATSDAERARLVEALIRLYADPNNRYID